MTIDMDLVGMSESGRKLWNLENYPHAELYYDLAYRAITAGDIEVAMKYFRKTVDALEKGSGLTILNGQKPGDENYDGKSKAALKVVR